MIEAGASIIELDNLSKEFKQSTNFMTKSQKYYGKVGAFEGGGYLAKGLYRPEIECIMLSFNRANYCRVCSEAIENMIDWYVK